MLAGWLLPGFVSPTREVASPVQSTVNQSRARKALLITHACRGVPKERQKKSWDNVLARAQTGWHIDALKTVEDILKTGFKL